MSDDETPQIKSVQPHQLGWLRRPELDSDKIIVWERPDGQLMAVEKHAPPLVLEVLKRPKHG